MRSGNTSMVTMSLASWALWLSGFLLLVLCDRNLVLADEPLEETIVGLGWLQGAELDPSGTYLATWSDTGLQVWTKEGSLVRFVEAWGRVPLAGFAWSPQGDAMALANYLGQIRVVSFPNLSAIAELDYDYGVQSGFGSPPSRIVPWPLDWSPDGSLLAFGWCDGKAHVFHPSSGRYLRALKEANYGADVVSLDWSPDGRLLTRTGWDSTLVYNYATGEILHRLDQEEHASGQLSAFSPDGSLIATVYGRMVRFHETETGQVLASLETEIVECMAWSGDSEYVCLGTRRGGILVYTTEGGLVINHTAYSSPVVSLSWRGSLLASSSEDQTACLWEIDAGSGRLVLTRSLAGWGSGVRALEWFPDGVRILVTSAGRGDPVRVLDTSRSGQLPGQTDQPAPGSGLGLDCLQIQPRPREGFVSASVSCDGSMIATISMRGEVSVWDSVYGSLAIILDAEGGVDCCAWSPTKPKILAVAGPEGAQVYNVADSPVSWVRLAAGEYTSCLAWSPDGDLLALGHRSRVDVWDPHRPTAVASIATWRNVISLAWSPEGSRLACLAGYDELFGEPEGTEDMPPMCRVIFGGVAELGVWDASGLSQGLILLAETLLPGSSLSPPGVLAWSPNSSVLAAATGCQEYILGHGGLAEDCFGDNAIPSLALWSMEPGGLSLIDRLSGFVRPASSVAWSPDGSRVAGGGDDGSIRIWRLGPVVPMPEHQGTSAIFSILVTTILLVITGPGRPVRSLAWRPDCTAITAGSNDDSIHLWPAGPPCPEPG